MNLTRTRAARSLMIGATLGLTIAVALSSLTAAATNDPEAPSLEAVTNAAPAPEPAVASPVPVTDASPATTDPVVATPAPEPPTAPESSATEPVSETTPPAGDAVAEPATPTPQPETENTPPATQPGAEDAATVSTEQPTPPSSESQPNTSEPASAEPSTSAESPVTTPTSEAPLADPSATDDTQAEQPAISPLQVTGDYDLRLESSCEGNAFVVSLVGLRADTYADVEGYGYVDLPMDQRVEVAPEDLDGDGSIWVEQYYDGGSWSWTYWVTVERCSPAATTPSVPRSVTATPGNASATVAWAAPTSTGGSPITGYTISYLPAGGTWTSINVSATTHSRTITGLRNGTNYGFEVSAINAAGRSPSSSYITAVPRTVPTVPRSLTATAGINQTTLRWAAPASNGGSPITGYTVSYAPSGGTWTSINVSASAASRTISALRGGSTYYFRITANNVVGRSTATTSSVRVSPATKPGGMSQMYASPGNGRVSLYWTAPASNGSPITRYAIQRRLAGSNTWSYISYDTPAWARSFTAVNLTNGTGYGFRIAAINALGIGTWSYPIGAVPRTVPGAVSGLRSTSGSSTINMSWGAPASNGGAVLRYYRVEVWEGWYWRTIGTTSVRSMTISNVWGCWSYRVAAVNDAGTGSYRSIYKCGLSVPGAVSGLRATTGYNSLTLTWNAPSTGGRPSYYRVQAWQGWYWRTINTTTSRSMYLTNGWGCPEYRVAAVNGAGTGWYSSLYACWRY